MTMVMGVPLAFFIAINSKKWWVKLLCLAAVAMQVHVVLFSYSRGGQLGLVLVGMTIFIIAMLKLPRKGVTIGLAVVFLAFGLYFAGNEVRSRFQSIFLDPEQRDESARSRFATRGAAWACMQDHPMGVGPRNFNLLASRYGLPGRKSVHNLFLQTGADYGFIGMFGLALFYFGTMYKAFRMAATKTAKRLIWPRYYGHMVCISLGGFLVCSTFIGMESVESSFIISLLGLCTVAHVDRVAQEEPAKQSVPELEQVSPPGDGEPMPA
jgi:O-antigen ligase